MHERPEYTKSGGLLAKIEATISVSGVLIRSLKGPSSRRCGCSQEFARLVVHHYVRHKATHKWHTRYAQVLLEGTGEKGSE